MYDVTKRSEMMLEERILHYTDKELHDLSCSEIMLLAGADQCGFPVSRENFHMMAPFAGGMKSERVCGALTGSLAVLGILFTENRSRTSPLLEELVREFLQRFEQETSSLDCGPLKQAYRTEEEGCRSVMLMAARHLEAIIQREQSKIRWSPSDSQAAWNE